MRAPLVPGSAGHRDTERAGLGGTGRVADDLWLMAHHEVSGRPFLQPRALGTGLAAALLAELMLGGSIVMRPGGVLAACRARPADALAGRIHDQVAGEPELLAVPEWLLFLGPTAAQEAAARLARSGYLTRAGGRLPWQAPRWAPVDPDWAFAPLIRACSALDPARAFDIRHVVLAGLAGGCGLGFRLAQYLVPAGLEAGQAARRLDPGLRELIAQAQAAVDSAILSHRT